MCWGAPEGERADEPFNRDERQTLEGLLEWGRSSLLRKCTGLTANQPGNAVCAPSRVSLLGLVRHLTDVERSWLRRRFDGQVIAPLYSRADSTESELR
jgi:hypothetical protein